MILGVTDWQPLINAAAALMVAATPVLVALLWGRVHSAEANLKQGQQVIEGKVDALAAHRAGDARTRATDPENTSLGGKGGKA